MSLGSQCFSFAFVMISGTAVFVFELSRPQIVRQPWFSPLAIVVLVFLNYFAVCYLWWRWLVKLEVYRMPPHPVGPRLEGMR